MGRRVSKCRRKPIEKAMDTETFRKALEEQL